MNLVLEGQPSPPEEPGQKRYLLKKLEGARRDCQWILGLGAAGVLGVVIKDGLGSEMPGWRLAVLCISGLQILIAMLGSLSMWAGEIDKAQLVPALIRRLRFRYRLRDISVLLLAASLILIAFLGWSAGRCPIG